ncbi:MAG TPA: hypothetical protein DCE11_04355, partial [Ruminiclostridium sp.]|nr:hypothetical protein [Ruminiclostridium sp.]
MCIRDRYSPLSEPVRHRLLSRIAHNGNEPQWFDPSGKESPLFSIGGSAGKDSKTFFFQQACMNIQIDVLRAYYSFSLQAKQEKASPDCLRAHYYKASYFFTLP